MGLGVLGGFGMILSLIGIGGALKNNDGQGFVECLAWFLLSAGLLWLDPGIR